MIGSKTTEKRWRHHFPHYKSMGALCCQGNQSFDPICLKTLCSLSPPPVMLDIKFDRDWPTALRDIQIRKFKIFVIQEQVAPKLVVWSDPKSNMFNKYPEGQRSLTCVQCARAKSHLKTYKWVMETRGPKSNSSKLLCLSWLPATLMMIWSKMNELALSDYGVSCPWSLKNFL